MKLETLVGKELYKSIIDVRENSVNYEEIVLLIKDMSEWNKALTDKLGPPLISKEEYEIVGSSEDVLSSKIDVALKFADDYGGINQGQTLYHGIYDSNIILIMIWPWQDNERATLKKAIL